MPFKKGDKKPQGSGMKKGQKIKSSVSFSEDLERLNFNLADKIVEVFGETQDVSIRVRLLELVAKYRIPIPKSIEQLNPDDTEEPKETEVSILNIVKEK